MHARKTAASPRRRQDGLRAAWKLDTNLTYADPRRLHRPMLPLFRRALPPIWRELRANYRLSPQRNVAKQSFRPVWPQQILMGLQRASHNLSCPGVPSYHENSCGVWAITPVAHTISPRIKSGCRRRLDVTVLEQMPIIPPQDRKAAGSIGQKSPLSRH